MVTFTYKMNDMMATGSDYSIVQTRSTNSLDSKTLEPEYLHFVI